jgi:uroporphyrinogen decarboxylase
MTPAELVRAALCHRETERLPYNFMLSPPAARKLRDHLHLDEVEQWVGSCLYFYGPSDKPLYAHPEKYGATITDQWGVVWATSTIDRGYPITHPLRDLDLTGYPFPDPLEPRRWRHLAQNAVQPAGPPRYSVAVIGDLWERANFLCGLDTLLLALRDRPAFVHDLLARIVQYNLATLEHQAPYRPDAFFLSDDYGLQRSLMMSPADWRMFLKPHVATLAAAAHAHGARFMLHSCGHVTEIIPDLIELGLDILHPVQPEAMDLAHLKREYGRDLTFCGGLNTQQLLPYGTPAEIRSRSEPPRP